jgi:hypothetical protein
LRLISASARTALHVFLAATYSLDDVTQRKELSNYVALVSLAIDTLEIIQFVVDWTLCSSAKQALSRLSQSPYHGCTTELLFNHSIHHHGIISQLCSREHRRCSQEFLLT